MQSRLICSFILVLLYLSMVSQSTIAKEMGKTMDNAQQNAKRITRLHKARYHGTPDKVFPLLCPVVEYDWLENWQTEMVYTDSGVAELDSIFKTFFEPGETEVWMVTRYEANERIEFIVTSIDRMTHFSITLQDNSDGTTSSEWKQVITALTPKGETEIEALTEEVYAKLYEGISMRLNYFLENGKMYKEPAH